MATWMRADHLRVQQQTKAGNLAQPGEGSCCATLRNQGRVAAALRWHERTDCSPVCAPESHHAFRSAFVGRRTRGSRAHGTERTNGVGNVTVKPT